MIEVDKICLKCMHNIEDNHLCCPYCGFKKDESTVKMNCLPAPVILNGRYLVGEPLGIGGFGITYIAFDMKKGVVCAVKEYMPGSLSTRYVSDLHLTFNAQRVEEFNYGLVRFMEEAKMLSQFQNDPNIISVYDLFEENSTAYYVMEYISGTDLKSYVKDFKTKLNFEDGISIMIQVMAGLEHLHNSKVIHRDISPDNIYITQDNHVKILDFGSARYSLSQKNRNLSVIVKVGYAPPEQYSSNIEQGAWTDIYALAATFYHLFTGVIPPESTERLLNDSLNPLSMLRPEFPPAINSVIMRSLALKVFERYNSIAEMRKDLLIGLNHKNTVQNCSANFSQNNISSINSNDSSSSKNSSANQVNIKIMEKPQKQLQSSFHSADIHSSESAPKNIFGKRVLAYLFDYILFSVIVLVVIFAVKYLIYSIDMLDEIFFTVTIAVLIFSPVIFILLLSLFESSKKSATVGKLIFGIKVVDAGGNVLSFTQSLLRNTIKLLSFLLLLTEKNNTYLHERMSHSKVILKE